MNKSFRRKQFNKEKSYPRIYDLSYTTKGENYILRLNQKDSYLEKANDEGKVRLKNIIEVFFMYSRRSSFLTKKIYANVLIFTTETIKFSSR